MSEVTFGQIIGKKGIFVDGDWIESKDQDPNGDVRLIQLADIGEGVFLNKSKKYLTKRKALELKCTFLQAGDLLIARMPDPIGRACVFLGFHIPCITAVDVCIVRPDDKLALSDWLNFMVNSNVFKNKINKYLTGTTRTRISRSNLAKIKFNLPQLTKQKRISETLKKAVTLRQIRLKSIALLDEYLKSVFYEMFGDPMKNEKGWEMKPFGQIFKGIRYGTGSPPLYSENGLPFIRATNIKGGTVVENDLKYISESEALKIEKCKLEVGNLILVRSGVNAGDCAIINSKYPDAYAGYDLIIEIDFPFNEFYNYLINTNYYKSVLKPLSRRAGQPHLNAEQIQSLKLIFPSEPLLQKFSKVLEQIEYTKIKMQESMYEMDNLFNSLMQRAFKGEL